MIRTAITSLLRSYAIAVTFLGLILLGYYLQWSISGDDVYSILNRTSLPEFARALTDFSGQYRPLTYLLFNLYAVLLPHYSAIFMLHLLLVALIPVLTSFLFRHHLPFMVRTLLSFTTVASAVMFYHFFAIASLANTLIIIVLLLQAILAEHIWRVKKPRALIPVLSLVLVLISMGIKETWIVQLPLVAALWWILARRHTQLFQKLRLAGAGMVLVLAVYVLFRLTGYAVTDTDYSFVLSVGKLKENLLNLLPWTFLYPRGWQYGVPEAQPFFYKPMIGLYVLLIATAWGVLFWRKRVLALLYGAIAILAIGPFLFLMRLFPFYADLLHIVMILVCMSALAVLFQSELLRKMVLPRHIPGEYGIAAVLMIILGYHMYFALPQWTQYSFVGIANQMAKNYQNTLSGQDLSAYQRICILNHRTAEWADAKGQFVYLFSGYTGPVISTEQEESPAECLQPGTLTFYNLDREYKRVEGAKE